MSTTTTTTTVPVAAAVSSRYRAGFPYDAAERRAREAGLCVVAVTAASLPAGASSRDGYGNHVKAETVWVGYGAGHGLASCAWGICCSSIHQQALPGLAEALRAIAESLQAFETFGSRDAHFSYYRSCCRGAAELAAVTASWREIEDCAQRALRVLPAELLAWLRTVPV